MFSRNRLCMRKTEIYWDINYCVSNDGRMKGKSTFEKSSYFDPSENEIDITLPKWVSPRHRGN